MITFENNDVLVHIELWDERKKYIRFINCLGLKEKQCIGDVIGDISVEEDSFTFPFSSVYEGGMPSRVRLVHL